LKKRRPPQRGGLPDTESRKKGERPAHVFQKGGEGEEKLSEAQGGKFRSDGKK